MSELSGWQLKESGPEAYERYIVPAWMGKWARALVEIGNIGPGKRVLDLACGTGIVSRKAARLVEPGGRIFGVDLNEAMIRAAMQFAEREGIGSIEWKQADATCLPFREAEFDVVFCQQGLQFFPNPLAALREAARVMAPGGRLALSVWRALDRYPCFKAFSDVLESYLGDQSAASFHASCSLGDREKLRSLLSDAGFCDIHIRLELKMARYPSIDEFIPGYLSATPIASEIAAMNASDRKEMIRTIKGFLNDYADDDGLAAPMECHMITACK